MKYIIILIPFYSSLAYATLCADKRAELLKLNNRISKLAELKKKNEFAYNKTTNSLKKIKISSNLIIISNKSQQSKVELEKLNNEFNHCF